MDSKLLKPGDCLLYGPASVFGWAIMIKTWHAVSHVEVYDGGGISWASRDGVGVDHYPLRTAQLKYVLRPTQTLNWIAADTFALSIRGTKYGWLELLNFVGVPVKGQGIFCSQFATEYYRQAGWTDLFVEDDAAKIAPFEFLNLVDAGFEDVTAATLEHEL